MNPYLPPGNAGPGGGGQWKDSLLQQNMELIRSKLYTNAAQERPRYLRLIDSCITQLKAKGPSRTCNVSTEEDEKKERPRSSLFFFITLKPRVE